ncbi:MAG: hypothetical protein RJB66_1294 [Pseudomonadota bacterium]|jgi:two-component system phosphate regulon response regulator PhoB
MTNKSVVIIEDESEIRDLVQILLTRQGFRVVALGSVEEFRQWHVNNPSLPIDLIVLDWMLPGESGFDFLKDARQHPDLKLIPVIMVTAKAEPEEVVSGLENGADDYLVKPFDGSVLVARVKALLRRAGKPDLVEVIEFEKLKINLQSFEALLDGEKLPLTATEFKLLSTMAQRVGKVFTREQLVQAVQGEGVNVIGRTVDTHVFSLRKKLGPLGDCIETCRGIGYRFRELEGTTI